MRIASGVKRRTRVAVKRRRGFTRLHRYKARKMEEEPRRRVSKNKKVMRWTKKYLKVMWWREV